MKLPIQRTKSNWNNLSLKEVIKSYEEAKGLNLLKEEEQEWKTNVSYVVTNGNQE